MHTLAELIAPISVDDFIAFYKGNEAFRVSGSAGRFSDLFDWERFNRQLNFTKYVGEHLKVIDDSKPVNINPHDLHKHAARGATFVHNELHRTDPAVQAFCQALSGEMNMGVGCNCYASFPGKQGFSPHFDDHDVLILQLSGVKEWKVFHPSMPHPLKHMLNADQRKAFPENASPYLECALEEGDVLYIPRGHWHYAMPETPSLHLTVGIYNTSMAGFLAQLQQELTWSEEFLRMDTPVIRSQAFGGDRNREEFSSHIERFRELMLEFFRDADLQSRFVEFQMKHNRLSDAAPLNFPQQAALIEFLTPEIHFHYRPYQKTLVRFDPETRTTTVICRGNTLEFDNSIDGLLTWILEDRDYIDGNAILEAYPQLSWEQVQKILVSLYEAEVLVLPPPLRTKDAAE